jgi:mycothiol system anti-sigma-R factor
MTGRQSPESQPDCAEVVLRLFEYVDNEAAEDDGRRIQEHLDECGSCLREYERDVLVKALVRRACECEPAPEALRIQIMARITSVSVTTYRSGDGA